MSLLECLLFLLFFLIFIEVDLFFHLIFFSNYKKIVLDQSYLLNFIKFMDMFIGSTG